MPRRLFHLFRLALGILLFLCFITKASALVGSNGGDYPPFTGVYINQLLGADYFYYSGFNGQNAVVANVEAGVIWNGHETLSHAVNITETSALSPQLGSYDWHATMVGQVLGGNGMYTYQDGIAPGATLWSSGIATEWSGTDEYTGSFSITSDSFLTGYLKPLVTGVNGQKANVINSSWGFEDPSGSAYETVAVDALLRQSGAVGVFSAGNSGPGANTVGGLASGYNGISVGAMTGDTLPKPFSQIADFSSGGPSDFYTPATNNTFSQVRPTVDIVAPGDNLTLAFYGGVSGGHLSGTDMTSGSGGYYIRDMGGTSFSAPIVAGGAALLVGAGKAFGISEMTDPRVIKAVLLTSADKPAGWDNGQHTVNGIVETTQALDFRTGAGELDLGEAFKVYVGDFTGMQIAGINTTLGISGSNGGAVQTRGWDLGAVEDAQPNSYLLESPLVTGDLLNVTLTWFADRELNLQTFEASDLGLDDLSLQIWASGAETPLTMIALSDSPYTTTEHLSIQVPFDGTYSIRVIRGASTYDLSGTNTSTTYALAWDVQPVPEPSQAVLLLLALGAIGMRRPARQ